MPANTQTRPDDPPGGARNAAQAFEDIVEILKSLPNRKLKGVRLEIDAAWFGAAWAQLDECQQSRFVGVVQQWKVRGSVHVSWDIHEHTHYLVVYVSFGMQSSRLCAPSATAQRSAGRIMRCLK